MPEENIAQEEVWKPSKNPWIISIPLMISMFMFVLDETISNVACHIWRVLFLSVITNQLGF